MGVFMSFRIDDSNPTIIKIHEFNNTDEESRKSKIKQLSKNILLDQDIKEVEHIQSVVSLISSPLDRQAVCHCLAGKIISPQETKYVNRSKLFENEILDLEKEFSHFCKGMGVDEKIEICLMIPKNNRAGLKLAEVPLKWDKIEIVEALTKYPQTPETIELLLKLSGKPPRSLSRSGRVQLIEALAKYPQTPETVELLLKLVGKDASGRDKAKMMEALAIYPQTPEILKLLPRLFIRKSVEEKVEIMKTLYEQNNDDKIPFILKAIYGPGNRRKDFNINEQYGYGNTALITAAINGDKEIVEVLLNRKDLDINIRNNGGKNALMVADAAGHKDILKLFIDCKDHNFNERQEDGNTPFMSAAAAGRIDIIEMFLNRKDHNIIINERDNEGDTALILAVNKRYKDIVEMLIKKNADLNLTNNNGWTALALATLLGYKEIEEILEKALTPTELLRQKQILRILSVAHSAHLKGISQLHTIGENFAPLAVDLEGAHIHYWLKRMGSATQSISNYLPDLLSSIETKELLELLETGMNPSNQIVLENIKKGRPVLLSTGSRDHEVVVLIWGNLFILCNRGDGSRKNIEVFQFDPNALNNEVLNKISQVPYMDINSYKKLFFEELPSTLQFKQDQFEKDLEQVCNLVPQAVGNCSWASPEAAVWAFFVLRELLDEDLGKLGQFKPITEEQTAKFRESEKFYTWLVFNQMYNLERYLGMRQVRSSENPEKVEKSAKGRKVNVIDYPLVSHALKSIEGLIHQHLKEEMVASKVRRDLHSILARSVSMKIEGVDDLMAKHYFDELRKTIHSENVSPPLLF